MLNRSVDEEPLQATPAVKIGPMKCVLAFGLAGAVIGLLLFALGT